MLNETTTKMFVAVGSLSTGSIAKDVINQSAADKVVNVIASTSPDVLARAQMTVVESSSSIDWATWAHIAGIAGVLAMVLRFAFEIYFKMKYERPRAKKRRLNNNEN